ELARSNLVLDTAISRIDQVEVPPPIALRRVNNLFRVFQPVHQLQADVLLVRRPDECLTHLVDNVERIAGLRIDAYDAESLVPAVDLLIGEVAAVGQPAEPRLSEIDHIHIGLPRRSFGDVEKM